MVALAISLFTTTLANTWANLFAGVFFVLALIAAAYSISKSRIQLLVLIGLCLLAVLPIWGLVVADRKVFETINNVLWLMLTFYFGLMVFQDIMKAKQIHSNEIYGAISVYLLIGAFFGIIYQIVLVFDPNAFYFNPTNFKDPTPREWDIFYYSIITLATVGFGDVTPVAPVTRSISMIESVMGVMYVAIMI